MDNKKMGNVPMVNMSMLQEMGGLNNTAYRGKNR